MKTQRLPTIEEALEEMRRKPLVDLWPTVAVALDCSRGTVYAEAEQATLMCWRLGVLRRRLPPRCAASSALRAI